MFPYLIMTMKKQPSERTKELAAAALAEKIGYLQVMDFPINVDFLPRLSFNKGRSIRSKDNLYVIKSGSIIIKQPRLGFFVKELGPGVVFGNMALLGQTLLGTVAIAESKGAILGVLDTQTVKQWIVPIELVEKLGSRLHMVETEHYRVRFQITESRLAALLLALSGEGSTVEGLTHDELAKRLGVYRETISHAILGMVSNRLIEVGRRKINILDRIGLKELSDL